MLTLVTLHVAYTWSSHRNLPPCSAVDAMLTLSLDILLGSQHVDQLQPSVKQLHHGLPQLYQL